MAQGGSEIVRRLRLKDHSLSRDRVGDGQAGSVEQLPGNGISGGFSQTGGLAKAIDPIPGDGKSKMLEMHTNLVSPARVRARLDERRESHPFQDPIARVGRASAAGDNRHPLALGGMTPYGAFNFARLRRELAAHNGLIYFLDLTSGKLAGEIYMRAVAFCNHKASAGVFVKPMNDSRPDHPANAAKAGAAVVQQRVYQSMPRMARAGMNDQSRRFVEHQQMLVLVKNSQRNFLPHGLRRRRLRPSDGDQVPRARMMRGLNEAAIDTNVPLAQKPLNCASGYFGELGAQKPVQTFQWQRLGDGDGFGGQVLAYFALANF